MTRVALLIATAAAAAALVAGCGGSGDPGSAAAPGSSPSRPGLDGAVLAVLERQDLQFGRHDTLTIGTDGRANLVLAHGGGGFRTAACAFSAAELAALRRDLRAMPLGRPPRRSAPARPRPHADGVISAKPPLFAVTYRGHRDLFSADAVPAGGAPLQRHITRVLAEREARCRVTFHRP